MKIPIWKLKIKKQNFKRWKFCSLSNCYYSSARMIFDYLKFYIFFHTLEFLFLLLFSKHAFSSLLLNSLPCPILHITEHWNISLISCFLTLLSLLRSMYSIYQLFFLTHWRWSLLTSPIKIILYSFSTFQRLENKTKA